MTIEERIQHLSNLTVLIDHFERGGNSIRNKWIIAEFQQQNDELMEILKDKHDETRKRK